MPPTWLSDIALLGRLIMVGIPLGAYIIRRMDAETFRRICMSFDAWVVGFGLSRVVIEMRLIASPAAYAIWMLVLLVDLVLLRQYLGNGRHLTEAAFVVDECDDVRRVRRRETAFVSGDV